MENLGKGNYISPGLEEYMAMKEMRPMSELPGHCTVVEGGQTGEIYALCEKGGPGSDSWEPLSTAPGTW